MTQFLPFANERIAVLSITRHGVALCGHVIKSLPGAKLFVPEKFSSEAQALVPDVSAYACKTAELVPELFARFDAIVAVISLGAMVRMIAPHIKDKEQDPGVVVMDEAGRYAIPVLAGHLGGANALAGHLAKALGAAAVLTTASDSLGTLAVDLLGRELGWTFEAEKEALLAASAAVVNGEPVALVQEAGSPDWWRHHANGRNAPLPQNLRLLPGIEGMDAEAFGAVLWITHRPVEALPQDLRRAVQKKLVVYRPPCEKIGVALGIGCDRGADQESIAQAVSGALAQVGRAVDIARIASIDLKQDEVGLLAYAKSQGQSIAFYPAERLAQIPVPNPSEVVKKYTGTPSVSEAAALLAAGSGELLVEKFRYCGTHGRNVTISIARMAS